VLAAYVFSSGLAGDWGVYLFHILFKRSRRLSIIVIAIFIDNR
jgi:hypothetical protein